MSLVDVLTKRWQEDGGVIENPDYACWWLNAIADEMEEYSKSYDTHLMHPAGWLRSQAQEPE